MDGAEAWTRRCEIHCAHPIIWRDGGLRWPPDAPEYSSSLILTSVRPDEKATQCCLPDMLRTYLPLFCPA